MELSFLYKNKIWELNLPSRGFIPWFIVGIPILATQGILGTPGIWGIPGILGTPGIWGLLGTPGIWGLLGTPGIWGIFTIPGIWGTLGPPNFGICWENPIPGTFGTERIFWLGRKSFGIIGRFWMFLVIGIGGGILFTPGVPGGMGIFTFGTVGTLRIFKFTGITCEELTFTLLEGKLLTLGGIVKFIAGGLGRFILGGKGIFSLFEFKELFLLSKFF